MQYALYRESKLRNGWNDDRTWRSIDVHEAEKLYPYTVPRDARRFKCPICGQYLAFADSCSRSRFFTHGAYSGACEEKIDAWWQDERGNKRSDVPGNKDSVNDLVIRVVFKDFEPTFGLELGLFALPSVTYQKYKKGRLVILAHNGSETPQKNIYEMAGRFFEQGISYFPLDQIAHRYEIQMEDGAFPALFWNPHVKGFSQNEIFVFDSFNGRRVEGKKRIVLNRIYYMLLKDSAYTSISEFYDVWYEHSVKLYLEHIKQDKSQHWLLIPFEINEVNYSSSGFAKMLGCKLCTPKMELTNIWPPCYTDFSHKNNFAYDNCLLKKGNVFGLVQGASEILILPNNTFSPEKLSISSYQDYRSLSLIKMDRFAGLHLQSNLGDNRDFWISRDDLKQYLFVPKSEATISGISIAKGEIKKFSDVPKLMKILLEYDGHVIVYRRMTIFFREEIKAGVPLELEPHRGERIVVCQGRDVVYDVSFGVNEDEEVQEKSCVLIDELKLVRRLNRLDGVEAPVPHSLGALASRLGEYPQVKKWLCRAIRKGRASQKALTLIKKTFRETDAK